MIFLAFFQWWYGPGWAEQIRAIPLRVRSLADTFSIGILLRTLFAPWKQIVGSSRPGQSVNIKFRVGIDNVVSRFVGFSVRIIVLFVALIAISISVLLSCTVALIWPILPSLVLFLIPLGFAL